jgi:hypothetical protein
MKIKLIRILIFAGGLVLGLFLAGLLFVSWQIHQKPPDLFFYYPAPPYQGTLRISLYNATKHPIGAVVVLDDESVMSGVLPGRSPLLFPHDFSAFAAFSPTLGKHELSVVVGDVGKIATKEIIQEINKTNDVEIYIKAATTGTNPLDCNFFVYTNVTGSM